MARLDVKTRLDFQQLAEARFLDAKALFAAGRFGGAYYLAGYAVECALKACIAKFTNAGDFPPRANDVRDGYYTHNLKQLVATADLKIDLETERRDRRFETDWTTVSSWSEEKRYDTQTSANDALSYLNAVQDDTDAAKGILPWLRTHW